MFGPLRRRRNARFGVTQRSPVIELMEARHLLATFVVSNSASDGPGSLRSAIVAANVEPDADRIEFNIPGPGPHVIRPTTPLDELFFAVTIDGTTQPGFAGVPLIELNGVNVIRADSRGLILLGNSTVRGLAISQFNRAGISTFGPNNVVEGNFIGTDSSGTQSRGNGIGIELMAAEQNRIGGSDPRSRNVISGNDTTGILLGLFRGTTPSRDNEIFGNYIGTDRTGQVAIGNGQNGDESAGIVLDSSSDNDIGGPAPGMGNLISGNLGAGVLIVDGSADNRLLGNLIGTDQTGSRPLGNAQGGVVITESVRNQIGNGTEIGRNIISGNSVVGISIASAAPGENQILGNRIGTNEDGDQAIPNSAGIIVANSSFNQIGGVGNNLGNLISGNLASGVSIMGANATDNVVRGNTVGSDADGVSPVPNAADGIQIDNTGFLGGDSRGNEIGGDATDAGNLIRFNLGAGVAVIDRDADPTAWAGNRIRFNSIAANSHLGIDLRPEGVADGITPNDPGDLDTGPNGLQNFPILEAIEPGVTTRVHGFLDRRGGRNYLIDIYRGQISTSARVVEGRQYLGSAVITPQDDMRFEFSVGQTGPDDYITATAIDFVSGDTSEFSPLGRVDGQIVEDLTANGITDDDEPIADWRLELFLDNGDGVFDPVEDILVDTTRTDATGRYGFEHVRPGTYFTVQEVRDGYVQSSGGDDPDGTSPFYARTVVSGSEFPNLDFSNYRTSQITGRKLVDKRRDGISPDDLPLAGWTIELFRETDGELVFLESEITGEDGRYQFLDLAPGSYVVEEVLQANFSAIEPATGSYQIEIQSGDSTSGVEFDFANFEVPEISGRKVEDKTGDGITPDDPPLADRIIQLFKDDGDGIFSPDVDELVQTTATDAEGTFEFLNVSAQLHFVVESEQIGFRQTAGGDDFPDTPFYQIDVMSGTKRGDLDFANGQISLLIGQKALDLTGDGSTADDVPFADFQILVYRDNGDGDFEVLEDELAGTARTNEQGEFLLDVVPGTYFVVDGLTEDHRQTDGGDSFPTQPYYTIEARGGRVFSGLDFANASYYPSGFVVRFAASADYDGDGNMDVALVNEIGDLGSADGSVTLYFGDGAGAFDAMDTIDVGKRPQSVVTANLDSDLMPDLVVTHVGDELPDSDGVLLMFNGGDAGFVRREMIPAGDGPIDVFAEDLDGDGLSDLAVANFRSDDVSILINEGDGVFVLADTVAVGRQPISVAGFDGDGDGDRDLVIANYRENTLSLLRNNGNGRFTLAREVATAAGPSDLYVAQLDELESPLDIAVTGFTNDQVAIHYDLTFAEQEPPVLLRLGSLSNQVRPQSIVAFDYTGDGLNDLAIAESESSTITLLQNEGRRRFSVSQSFPNAGGPEFVDSNTLNDDPSPDLFSTSLHRFVINRPRDESPGGLNVTLNRSVDLSIAISNDANFVIPGTPFTYAIEVGSSGPNPVEGATVRSVLDDLLIDVTYESFPMGDVSGNTSMGNGDINDRVNLGVGAKITYLVTATVSASTLGTLQSLAEVVPPVELVDINLSNNSDSDTDVLLPVVSDSEQGVARRRDADLSIVIDNDRDSVTPGRRITYAIDVGNHGPHSVVGASVRSMLDEALIDVTYVSYPIGDASARSKTGSGQIDDLINLAVGTKITYMVTATVSPSARGTLTNIVEVIAPDGLTDHAFANNSAADRDIVLRSDTSASMAVAVQGSDLHELDEDQDRKNEFSPSSGDNTRPVAIDPGDVAMLSDEDWNEITRTPTDSASDDEFDAWMDTLDASGE